MSSLVNILLTLLIATVATAGSIGRIDALPRSSGPGAPASPESPVIAVNLASDFLLTTLGFTGEATANQQISESVTGSSDVPATLSSSSSNSAILGQSGTAEEFASVEVPEETVLTQNEIDTEFLAAGSEGFQAALHGTSAAVEYAGESAVPLGGGVTLADANTNVEIISAAEK